MTGENCSSVEMVLLMKMLSPASYTVKNASNTFCILASYYAHSTVQFPLVSIFKNNAWDPGLIEADGTFSMDFNEPRILPSEYNHRKSWLDQNNYLFKIKK